MKGYANNFVYGRELMKKLLVGSVIAAVAAYVFQTNQTVSTVLTGICLILFASVIYIMVKFCRCPNCGKVIFLGVLAVNTCPRCKRSLVTGNKVKKTR